MRTTGGFSSERGAVRRLRRLLASVLFAVCSAMAVAAVGSPAGAVVLQVPDADVQVSGSVEQGPPGGGITTSDEMRYRINIRNLGPQAIPANALSVALLVQRAEAQEPATIEISRLGHPFIPQPGSACGVGRFQVIRCTNPSEIGAGSEVEMIVAHRHPAAEGGRLSFFVEVSPRDGAYVDPAAGNNSFSGPNYVFRTPPTSTTTTTAPSTSTTAAPGSSTSVDPNSSTSSTDSTTSTTAAISTTTTLAATTTTIATTTTTVATTTTTLATTTTSSVDAMVDGDASLPDQSSGSVLGATGEAELDDDGQEIAAPLGPEANDDGGPPVLLIGAILAVLLLMGGIGLALYAHYNQPPPLVDIRQYR